MPEQDDVKVVMEGVEIMWPNFSGEEKPFNRSGERNFCIRLDQETADAMAKDGFNVKTREPQEEGDDETIYMQIKLKYKFKPPKVYMITSTGRTLLDEGLVGVLDSVAFKTVDIIFRPVPWTIQATGKSGIAAYLQTMFVTIDEDPLELKYAALEGADV